MAKQILTLLSAVLLFVVNGQATFAQIRWGSALLKKNEDWYRTSEARAVADSLLQHQSPEGGWPKNTDFARPLQSTTGPMTPAALKNANSLDNGATTRPMQFLARIAKATDSQDDRDAVLRGIDYLLAAQYPSGGWPQFWPLRKGYYSRITYNDDAMINVMGLLQDVAEGDLPYDFVDDDRRRKAAAAVHQGVQCILKSQVRINGRLTAWCAQHDEVTLEPAWARAYEPPSLSGAESVGIVRFLMSIDEPTDETIAAVQAAVAWFKSVRMQNVKQVEFQHADGRLDRKLVPDAQASGLWARFYELETNRPLYLDRDSVFRYDFDQLSHERRNGYSYHGTWPASLLDRHYPEWQAKHGRL